MVFPVRANGFDALLDLGGEEVAVLEAAGAGGPFDVEIDPADLLVPVRLAQPGLLGFRPRRGIGARGRECEAKERHDEDGLEVGDLRTAV